MRLVYCSRVPLEGRRRGETERGLAAMEFGDALESVAKGKVACRRDAAATFSSCREYWWLKKELYPEEWLWLRMCLWGWN